MPEQTDQLVHTLQTHSDATRRRRAAEQLSGDVSPSAFNAFASALHDENESVRIAAVSSLAAAGGVRAAQVLVPLLETMPLRDTVREALLRLGRDAVSSLEPYVRHSDPICRNTAIEILGQIKHQDAAMAVIPLLYQDNFDDILAAVDALGNQAQEVSISHLKHVYEKEEFARPAVVEALGRIGGSEAGKFLCESFKSAMQVDSTDPLLLFRMIESLITIGDPEVISLLTHHLPQTGGKLRQTVLAAILWLNEKSGLTLDIPGATITDLVALLDDADVRVRLNAVQRLSQAEDPVVTRAFLATLGGSAYVDAVLFRLLEERQDSLRIMLDMLRSGDAPVKRDVILLLKSLMTRHGTHPAALLSKNDAGMLFRKSEEVWLQADDDSKRLILEILFMIDWHRTFGVLEKLLSTPDPWIRVKIIEILGTFNDPKMKNLIERSVSDEDEMVRAIAEWVLETGARKHDDGIFA